MTNFNIMRLIWNCYLIAILSVGPSIQYPKADCLIDVVFLFDESSAVPDAMFNKTLRTVDATLNILDVKEMGVNVGVSCYADTVRQIFQMDYFYSKTTIKSKINGMKRQTNVGLVNIQNALNRTCRVMFSSRAGGRAKAVNYLVVISPMTSVKDAELDAVVAYCKSRSVRIISITEGSSSVISNTIAYDSTYQFELKDENTVAKSLSTLIRDNAGCKEVIDRLAKWLETIIFGSIALITFIMCLLCFLQNRYVNRMKAAQEKYNVPEKKT
ncbi:Hypothetical predicted protein [Mytilus galloprovincialis]|uniref:VWFA domain-containing protein n=1 Tax=Mytilus galloprovincialis TaxID=29158 RepID=A0A8B6BYN7_MYTGA|nr:Hypothetical predicted protein [Mytilus galloprovincialis]